VVFLGILDVKSSVILNIPGIIEVDSITPGNFEKEISRFEKNASSVETFLTFTTF
jgi:hypothetical protein